MDKPRCRQPNGFKRLIAFLWSRCQQTLPNTWLDEPPADPDIGVREPRRPRPDGGVGTVVLEPPLQLRAPCCDPSLQNAQRGWGRPLTRARGPSRVRVCSKIRVRDLIRIEGLGGHRSLSRWAASRAIERRIALARRLHLRCRAHPVYPGARGGGPVECPELLG